MAKLGYVGYNLNIVDSPESGTVLMAWGPKVLLVDLRDFDRLLVEMEETMTESKSQWRYWQDIWMRGEV